MPALVVGVAPRQAAAQDNTLGGALLGGAAGAMPGSQLEAWPRYGHYFWYEGRCRRKARDGNYYRTGRRYCDDRAGKGEARSQEKGRPDGRPVLTPRGRNQATGRQTQRGRPA